VILGPLSVGVLIPFSPLALPLWVRQQYGGRIYPQPAGVPLQPSPESTPWPAAIASYARARGVPSEDLVLDYARRRT
jgi:hypothetical protein